MIHKRQWAGIHACFGRALEYVEVAEQREPDNMYSGFIRFKVLLEQADMQQAVQQLQRMLRSNDFTPDLLRVSMPSAMVPTSSLASISTT